MLIIAPHPDDELIGCSEVLAQRTVTEVWYVFDHTGTRRKEAEACAKTYGFEPKFLNGLSELIANVKAWSPSGRQVFIPAIQDSHPQHKTVNRISRHIATKFYSVDLEYSSRKQLLTEQTRNNKHDALNSIYPSQKALWELNHSYFLFESVFESDVTVMVPRQYLILGSTTYLTVHSDVHISEFAVPDAKVLCDKLVEAGASRFRFMVCDEVYEL